MPPGRNYFASNAFQQRRQASRGSMRPGAQNAPSSLVLANVIAPPATAIQQVASLALSAVSPMIGVAANDIVMAASEHFAGVVRDYVSDAIESITNASQYTEQISVYTNDGDAVIEWYDDHLGGTESSSTTAESQIAETDTQELGELYRSGPMKRSAEPITEGLAYKRLDFSSGLSTAPVHTQDPRLACELWGF